MKLSKFLQRFRRIIPKSTIIFFIASFSMSSIANSTKSDYIIEIDYGSVAADDLQQMRDALFQGHPAALDGADDKFFSCLENGYAGAIELARKAKTKADVLAVDRFFANCLLDSHVAVFTQDQVLTPPLWAGWTMDFDGESFYVANTATAWPGDLPPLGGKVVECDGEPVKAVLAEHFAPFIDGREALDASWVTVAKFATLETELVPRLPQYRIESCDVLHDGHLRRYSLTWNVDTSQHVKSFVRPVSFSVERLENDIFWVTLPTFQLSRIQVSEFERVLRELTTVGSSSAVVFDVRGNSGGDSLLAEKLLRSLYGNIPVTIAHERISRNTYADWRVSSIAVQELTIRLDALDRVGRHGDPTYLATQELRELMEKAFASKTQWVRQPNAPDAMDTPDSTGFDGRLAILTDASCGSACLNFVELSRNLPGALHLGKPTDADTNYLDITEVTLPSGFRFRLPLKIWRNRPRKSNEPLIPHVIYKGPMTDQTKVREWVSENLRGIINSGQKRNDTQRGYPILK